MGIILDADVIIGAEKGTFDLRSWVASRSEDQFEVLPSMWPNFGMVWNGPLGRITPSRR